MTFNIPPFSTSLLSSLLPLNLLLPCVPFALSTLTCFSVQVYWATLVLLARLAIMLVLPAPLVPFVTIPLTVSVVLPVPLPPRPHAEALHTLPPLPAETKHHIFVNRLNSDLSSSEEDDNDDEEEDQEEVRMETDTETIESDADSDKPINVHVRQNNNFEVESDADVDGFMDDSDDEDTKPDGTSKIRKPPGEVGRPNSGGYSLEKFLNWPASKYHSVMAFVKKQVHAEFNCALSLTEQLPENRERVWRNCLKKFPWLDDYHRLWPVDDFAVSRLKYAKSVIKKKEREALLEKCCDKSEAKGPRKTKNQRRKTSVRASARLGRRE
ncbi:hypothetical protein E1B28_009479 [Marasmius oreades]|uniref:Uncharacterized protein n=1 Tax=Marasmius oreades TaxID=181124 RepID=A0A9P7RV79_9AGAR|nr:uncharacterized protein E1B28_009479 [Marasmius oreades]KAG7090359.1 hypothetical protein E1B28_009479 [Marasmius oreades]